MAENDLINPEIYAPSPRRTGQFNAHATSEQPSPMLPVGEVSAEKERYASRIAQVITWTFAGCAGVLLFGVFTVVLVRPSDADVLLNKAAVPAITQIGTFLSSVFGPLLAFVLGYYFGEKQNKS